MNTTSIDAVTSPELARLSAMAAVSVLAELSIAIHDLKTVPSGTLYAAVMPSGISLDAYQAALRRLVGTGLIRVSADHLITWCGPNLERRDEEAQTPPTRGR